MRKWALLMMLLGGCAEVAPITAKVDVATLRLAKEQALGNEKVGIAIDLVTPDNVEAHQELMLRASWHEKNDSQVYTAGSVNTTSLKKVTAKLQILPLPAFIVRVINRTATPISFEHAQFALKDDQGRSYSIYTDAGDVQGRIEADLMSAHPMAANDNQLLDGLRDVVARLPLLNAKTRVPPNGEWQGYLVFKLSAHDLGELNDLLGGVKTMTLSVTQVDGAEPLLAQVERTNVTLTMSCQGDKTPSVKTCHLPEQN